MLTAIRPPRTITDQRGRDEQVVTLPDRLDVHQVAPLRTVLHRLDVRAHDRVTLDGSAVAHTDMGGLEFLAEVQTLCTAAGAELTLTNTSLALRLAIELTGTPGMPAERATDLLADFVPVAA